MAQPLTFDSLHWLREAQPLPDDHEPPPANADVVIVGGGYTGGATAYWLARRGVAPVLVERRGVSTGATGRNAGFIAPGLGMSFAEAAARNGHGGATDRLQFTRAGRDLALSLIDALAIECALEAQGGLSVATSDAEWESLRASGSALRAAGVPIDVLGPAELRDHLHLPPPDSFRGALFNPETLLVNPALLNNALVRAAVALGARVHQSTEAFALVDEPDDRIRVETSRGAIRAGRVVVAMNAWSPLVLGLLKGRIAPVRGQVLATAPAPPAFKRAMSANEGYEYWSQRADGTIVLGGARWAAPDRDEGYFAEEINPAIQGALERFLHEAFPALATVPVARRWSGIMGFSRDGYPFIGAVPGRPRLFVAAGYTGHGGPYFAIAGRCLAELIVDGRPSIPLDNYRLDRAMP